MGGDIRVGLYADTACTEEYSGGDSSITVENIVGHYARGQLDFHGTDLMTFIETLRVKNSRQRTRTKNRLDLLGQQISNWSAD